MPADNLKPYRARRDFSRTSEPAGNEGASGGNRFVVHKHSATADHYDLRLELNGVLKSWAVPRGPSLDPADKRFAAETEDHPVDYLDFEGVIPAGEYGGGPMIVWDTGTWAPMGDPDEHLRKGDFKFRLWGEKLKGGWMLARLRKKSDDGRPGWLLFKEHDPSASTEGDVLVDRPESVKTGRRIEELVAPPRPRRPVRLRPGTLKGALEAPMPERIEPQLATAVSDPPEGAQWLHEIKFDGYRTLAHLEAGKVTLVTRAGLDWTRRYGTLPRAFESLSCKSAVIDGEIVVPDENGIARFAALQEALSSGAGNRLVYYAFDLLHLDGWDLRAVPIEKRKELLAQLLGGRVEPSTAIQFSDHVVGDGGALFDRASELGLEGIVSKRLGTCYESGRTTSWSKTKALQVGDFVIAGFTRSAAAGGIGALALGEWVDGELEYRGKVGTGFDAATLAALLARLEPLADGGVPLERGPRDVVWVRPVHQARIHYATRTADNSLRHAVFKGLREAALSTPVAASRPRLVTDADLASIFVTNPGRRLFGRSGPTKLEIAVYYAAVGDFMLPHLFNRPVSLVRCPSGRPQDCFFQRHAFTGMPPSLGVFEVKNSDDEDKSYLSVEDARGYLALAQFGVVEFHTWGTHRSHLEKPDRIVFDLDPGEGIGWREMVEAAVHVRGELERLGLVPFVKTSGGKGIHVVVPIQPRLGWKQVHAATSRIAGAIAGAAPETFTATMGAANRKRRIFIDFHRNARSATSAAPYTLRARTGLPASTPLDWRDLEAIDAPEDLNYSSLPALLTTSGDPWADINQSARDIPAQSPAGKT
ncbi:MAG: DNA ligase D [Devosia sp.]|nr:DNA ligase D [Devosia sp.]